MQRKMTATLRPALVVTLRAEFKPLLSVVNILIEFPRPVIAAFPRLTVESHTISVETKQTVTVFHIDCLLIKPSTCRGLRWNSETELQLTMQAEWFHAQNAKGDADNTKTDQDFYSFSQELIVDKIKVCQSRCFCIGCGAQILKSSCEFKRVLPLPSENWTDFADIWFCHNHKNGTGHSHCHTGESTLPENLKKVKESGLAPRPEDCLVSSLYMLVSSRQVKSCAVLCSVDRLVCKRCGNFLGFVKLGDGDSGDHNLPSYFHDPFSGIYKIYFHSVSFRENFEDMPLKKKQSSQGFGSSNLSVMSWDQSIEGYLCNLLKDQSRIFTSFRFIIESTFQGEGQSAIFILLWLLDQELALFLSSLTSHVSLEVDEPELSPEACISEASHDTFKPKRISSTLTACKFMKVLYKVSFHSRKGIHSKQTSLPNVFSAWQKDNTVHGLMLPYTLCKQLVSILVSSTRELPRSQRSLNGFHVGYLKAG